MKPEKHDIGSIEPSSGAYLGKHANASDNEQQLIFGNRIRLSHVNSKQIKQ